jgi:hypothetical protein
MGGKDDESLEFGGVRISCAPFRFSSVVLLICLPLYIGMKGGEQEKIGYSEQIFWMLFLVATCSEHCWLLLIIIRLLIRLLYEPLFRIYSSIRREN